MIKAIYPYTMTFPEWTHRKIIPEMLDELRSLDFVLVADDYIGILRIIFATETISEKQKRKIMNIIRKYELTKT